MANKYKTYETFISNLSFLNDETNLCKICDNIEKLLTDDCDEEIKKLLKWEYELLRCCEIPLERRNDEQSYLFPKFVFVDGAKIPDIDNFEEERFEFYDYRLNIENNKILKLRYANYCFQFCDKNQKYIYANKISCLLIDILLKLDVNSNYVSYFSRLCELGLSYGDSSLIKKIEDVVKDFFAKDIKSTEYFYAIGVMKIIVKNVLNKKIKIKDTQAVDLIEKICNHYLQEKDFALYRDCCNNHLAWLKVTKQQDKANDILIKIGESFELEAEKENNSNLAKAELYRMAASHYANIGARMKVYKLKTKIKEILKLAETNGEYKTISSTQSVPVEELKEFSKAYIKDTINETLNCVITDMEFIINPLKARENAQKDFENNPIYKFIDFGRIEGNRKVFTTTCDNDAIKYLTYQNYGIELECLFAVYFNYLWNMLIEQGLVSDIVVEKICTYEYMDETSKNIVKKGIERFFDSDYISSLHILVPQFERLFRTFFEWGGFPTTSLKHNGLQYEQNFNDFLNQDFVQEALNDDLIFMIEYVMVSQIGKNLRNNIAHGLCDERVFNRTNCLIVLYLFFVITNLKWEITENGLE